MGGPPFRGNFELSGDSRGRQAGGDFLFWFPPGSQRHSQHSAFSQSSSRLFSTSTAHLHRFVTLDALRRRANRRGLCAASPPRPFGDS